MKEPRAEDKKGQISIMIAIMMSTFILFFAFVINTGMLVNAKINLQNAADLAAYAGAAVQARQLTQIGYLNYEMRRQYKKYLFRIYVLANMAEKSFPQGGSGGSGTTPMKYFPDNNTDYGHPTTCVIFNNMDNYCQLTYLPKITIPPPSVLDAVTDTLSGQLQAIEAIRQQNCKAIGVTNIMLSLYWLYNADPSLSRIDSGSLQLDAQQANTLRVLRELVTGLGIVPKEMLLRQRIKTLSNYVNAMPQLSLTKDQVDLMLQKPDPAPFERSAQAFYSAYYTLGNHSFPGASITLDELIPGDSSNAQLLILHDIKQQFDTYAIDYTMGTSGAVGGGINTSALTNSSQPQGSDCAAVSVPITIAKPLTLGVYKDPAIMTYYAIRLKAKARILFSPFGDLEMKAYSAAQPFGSRIGPSDQGGTVQLFAAKSGAPSNAASGFGQAPSGFLPNLAVREEDSSSRGRGWDTEEMVGTLFQALGTSGHQAESIDSNGIAQAYQVAMAPNPWEGNRYTILSDQGSDPFVKNFDTGMLAAFWAPIFPPGTQGDRSSFEDMVNGFFDTSAQGNLGSDPTQSSNLGKIEQTLKGDLTNYLSSVLQQGQGEVTDGITGDGINIVRIFNPFVKRDSTPIAGGPLFMTDSKLVKTSWNNVNRADYQATGRIGYSVKFISFDSLTKKKMSTNGSDTWTNSPNIDPESQQDIPFLKH